MAYLAGKWGRMNGVTEQSHKIDLYVGERLRERRKHLGLSQSALGKMVGLSLQQIQKYEQGVNRIAASKLYEFSQAIGVPINYFYDGVENIQDGKEEEHNGQISFIRKKPLAILLIEDNAADEVLTRKALEECEDENVVYSVHDGAEALQFMRNKKNINVFPRPDVVILDLNIPKLDGMSVLREIKRDRELQDIPVIILTNSINREEMLDAYRNQASGFICKSFDVKEFYRTINSLVKYWATVTILPSM